MKWKDPSSGADVNTTDESTKGTVKFSIVVEIKQSHNGDNFTCHTYFDKPQSRSKYADNIPINSHAFSERFELPTLNVYCKY